MSLSVLFEQPYRLRAPGRPAGDVAGLGMLFFLGAMPVYLTFERVPSDVPSRPA